MSNYMKKYGFPAWPDTNRGGGGLQEILTFFQP